MEKNEDETQSKTQSKLIEKEANGDRVLLDLETQECDRDESSLRMMARSLVRTIVKESRGRSPLFLIEEGSASFWLSWFWNGYKLWRERVLVLRVGFMECIELGKNCL